MPLRFPLWSSRAAGGVMLRRVVSTGCLLTAAVLTARAPLRAQGVDPSLAPPGRDPAQPVDSAYTRKILRVHHRTVLPLAAGGLSAGIEDGARPRPQCLATSPAIPTNLPYSKEVYAYMRMLAKATPSVRVFSIGDDGGRPGDDRRRRGVGGADGASRRQQRQPREARRSAYHPFRRFAGAAAGSHHGAGLLHHRARSTPPKRARRRR